MVNVNDKTVSLGTLIALIALLASGFTAWSDVKSDIAVNSKQIETNEGATDEIKSQLGKMNDKLDRLIEGMLEEERNKNQN